MNLRLDLYNSGGQVVATSGNVAVGGSYVALTGVSSAFDVARFVVSNQSGGAGQRHDVFVDDLTFDNGAAPADFSLGLPSYAGVAHASSVTVPLSITRLNGSAGNVSFTFPGLPGDLIASVSPNPASSSAAGLTISAIPSSSYRGTRTITVLGTPANAGVGPAARSITLYRRGHERCRLVAGCAAAARARSLLVVPAAVHRHLRIGIHRRHRPATIFRAGHHGVRDTAVAARLGLRRAHRRAR